MEPAALAAESLPSVLPGPLSPGALRVDEELPVGGVAHLSLERAKCLLLRLALGDLAVEVGPTFCVAKSDLGDRDDDNGNETTMRPYPNAVAPCSGSEAPFVELGKNSPENEPAPSYATSGMGSKRTVRPRALA